MDRVEDQIRRLYERNQEAATSLVFAEIDIGLTLCRISRSWEKSEPRYVRALARARNALRLAEKYMWKLEMRHPQFDQMMAQLELLRFELRSIENVKTRRRSRR
jgi:hypothetical protein